MVDDEPANLMAMEAVLGEMGHRLVKVGSGEAALKELLGGRFALVVLDVHMPGLDGFETARLIRERPRTRHIPIIFATAFDQTDERVLRGYGIGAVDFLFKPLQAPVLRAKVQVFVELFERTEEMKRQAEALRVPMAVQPEPLDHGEINKTLGLPSDYSNRVGAWIDRLSGMR